MKKSNKPKEQMKLTIEFADNGIILRNPEIEDEVTLAVHPDSGYNPSGTYYTEEYKAIGQKVYDWLTCEAIKRHEDFICTGAELNITATLNGREV